MIDPAPRLPPLAAPRVGRRAAERAPPPPWVGLCSTPRFDRSLHRRDTPNTRRATAAPSPSRRAPHQCSPAQNIYLLLLKRGTFRIFTVAETLKLGWGVQPIPGKQGHRSPNQGAGATAIAAVPLTPTPPTGRCQRRPPPHGAASAARTRRPFQSPAAAPASGAASIIWEATAASCRSAVTNRNNSGFVKQGGHLCPERCRSCRKGNHHRRAGRNPQRAGDRDCRCCVVLFPRVASEEQMQNGSGKRWEERGRRGAAPRLVLCLFG